MKKTLKNILRIRNLAHIKFMINIFAILFLIIIINNNSFNSEIRFYIVVFALGILPGIANLVLAILLIVNSTSIYIPSKDCNDEVVEELKTFKTTVLVWSILSILFNVIADLVIFIMSRTKSKMLREEIQEQFYKKTIENVSNKLKHEQIKKEKIQAEDNKIKS